MAVVYEGLGDDLKQAACETVLAHLDKLETEGRVCKRPDQDVDLWECKEPGAWARQLTMNLWQRIGKGMSTRSF